VISKKSALNCVDRQVLKQSILLSMHGVSERSDRFHTGHGRFFAVGRPFSLITPPAGANFSSAKPKIKN